ncbi:hypothetical protein [Niveispirillum sp. SYP-B3756]|uniref:hypothetical protein n=1 Tax=Niveispirillum sp. SYP-B3756 TaxID=2662178 RepID=UPI001565F40E|nr:hypothetical protein [Niveispirillum sp. SYP-B3756]
MTPETIDQMSDDPTVSLLAMAARSIRLMPEIAGSYRRSYPAQWDMIDNCGTPAKARIDPIPVVYILR